MGLLLYILSLCLRALLVPVSIVYSVVKMFYESHFDRAFKYCDNAFLEMATSIDKYGNAVCAPMFNDLLITKASAYPFGNIGQTISGVLGFNYMAGSLTPLGLWLNNALNYFWRDHTIRAATGSKEKPGTSQFILDLKYLFTLKLNSMKTFIYAVVIPAFAAFLLFSFADSNLACLIAAWAISAYVVILLAIHFAKKVAWFNGLWKKK